mmetsp:Transcript_7793/g.18659  ORF Transcript_7793/g.18659 Transcript_7793/m.18659 type:complete len:337 (+) Transcript_7793:1053-2063(+)
MPEVEGVAAGPNAERQRQEARWVDHVSTAEPHDPRGVLRREELLHERLDRGERPACEDDRPRLGEHLREVSCGVEEGKLQPGSSHSLLRGGADLRPLCDDPSVRVGVCQGGEEGEERLQSARASVRARRRLFALKPTFFRCGLGKGRHFICYLALAGVCKQLEQVHVVEPAVKEELVHAPDPSRVGPGRKCFEKGVQAPHRRQQRVQVAQVARPQARPVPLLVPRELLLGRLEIAARQVRGVGGVHGLEEIVGFVHDDHGVLQADAKGLAGLGRQQRRVRHEKYVRRGLRLPRCVVRTDAVLRPEPPEILDVQRRFQDLRAEGLGGFCVVLQEGAT